MNVWNSNSGASPWGNHQPQQPFQNASAPGMGGFFQSFQPQNFVAQQPQAIYVPQQPQMQQQMAYGRAGLLPAPVEPVAIVHPVPAPVPAPVIQPHPQFRGGLLGTRPALLHNPGLNRPSASAATTRAFFSAAAAPPPPPPPPPGPPPKSPARPPPPPPPPQDEDMDLDRSREEERPITPEEDLGEEEKAFKREFSEWEKKYEAWKEQNKNHPDKGAYQRYEAEWNTWRAKLLEKKESMRKDRFRKRAAAGLPPTSVTKDRVQPELVNVRNDRPSSAGIKDRPVPEKEVVEIASLIDPDDDGGNETGQFWSRQRKRTGSSLWLSGGRNAERNADESEAFPLLSARPAEERETEKVPQMTEESLREPSLPAPSPERAPSPVPVTVAVAKIVGRDSSDSEDDTENSVSSQRESSNSTPNRRPLLPTPNPAPGIGNSDLKAILATLHAAEKPPPPPAAAAAASPPHPPPPAAAPTPPPPPPPPVDKQVKKTLLPTPVEVVDLVEEPARNQEQPMDLEEDEGSLFERRGHSMEQEAAPFSFGKGDFDARVGVQPQNPFFGGDVDQRDRDERFPPFAARNQAQGGPRFNAPVGVLSFQQGPSQGFPQVQPLMQPNFPQQQQAAQPRSLLNIAPQHQQQVPLSNPNVLLLQQQQQQMFNNPNMRPDQQKQQQPMPFNNPNVHPEQQQQPMPFNNPNVHPEQQQQMPFNNPRILLQQQMPFNNPNVRPQQPWIDPREDDWPSIDKMRRMKELMKRRVEAEKELELDSRGNTPDYEDEEEDFDRGGKRSYLEEYEEKILPAFQNSPWWLSYHRDNLDHKSILDPEPDLDTDPNVHVYDEEDEELLVAKMKEPPVVKKENWDEDEEEVSQAKQGYEEEDQEVSGGDEEFDMRFRDSPWLPYHLEGTVHPSYTAKETRKEMGAKAPEWADSPWRDLHESDLDYPYESELQRLKRMAAEPLPYKPVNFDQYDIDALLADKRLPDAASAPVRPVAVGRTMPANVARPPGPNLRAEATKVWVEEYGEFVEFKNYTDRGLAPPRAARWSPKRGRNRMSFSPEPIPSSAPRMVQIPHPTDRWSPRRGNNRISLSPGDLSPISDDEGGRRTEAVRRYPEGRPHPPMVQIDRRPTSRERERERERERPRDNRDYRRQRSPAERGLSPEAMKDAPAWSYRQKEQRPRDLDREHDREWCQRELSRQEEKDRIFGNHWGSRKEAKSPSVQESPSPRNRGREESRGYRRPRSRTRSRSRMSRSRSRSRSDSRDRYRKKEYAPRQTPTSNRYQRCSKSRSPSRCASPSRRPSRWDDGNSSRQKDTTQEQRQAQLEKERKDKEDKQKSARQQLGSQWFDDALHELETGVLGPLADLVVPPPPSLKGVKFPAPAPQVVQVEVEEEEDEIIPPPPPSLRAMMMAAQAAPAKSPVIGIEELILPPGRNSRAGRIVVILRGPPGSGKSHVAKLIKDKEVEFGANAPRICGLDDYFMTEVDQFMTDENGRRTKTKVMKYEYEPELEESYRQSLVKAFKKTVDDGYFPFIIVDCIHDRVAHFEEMASYAKSRGFKVYVIQMEADPALCHRRNLHDRTLKEIESIMAGWEATPASYTVVKLDRLFDEPIEEVEMDLEDEAGNADVEMESKEELDEDDQCPADHVPSKWDCMEHTGEKLDKLDCMRMRKKSAEPETLEDWLQMDVYYGRNPEPGKKRVRWADIEAKKDQMRRRELGFVVGQTNWNDMNDPDFGASALTQTKYFTKD